MFRICLLLTLALLHSSMIDALATSTSKGLLGVPGLGFLYCGANGPSS